jgi:CRISPR/Cas system-associated exonuclease Cas4 (RecB family)
MQKKTKISLSFSTLNDLYICPHSYANKALGIEKPVNEYMLAGKAAHEIIEDHLIGKKLDSRLAALKWRLQRKEWHSTIVYNEKYNLHGFTDAIAFNSKLFCEIKTSTNPWSQGQFNDLMQWRVYALMTGFRKVLFITCRADLSGLRTYYWTISEKDVEKAKAWIDGGIEIIEKGDFLSDLVNNKCVNYNCPYGINCHWK